MLKICTANKNVQLVKSVFLPALQGDPNLSYKFIELTDHIPAVDPDDVMLVCGGFAVELMQDEGLVPKNRSINSLRQKPVTCPTGGGKIMITYDPGITQREADKTVLCQWDVRLAARLDKMGTVVPKLGTYKYTSHFNDAIQHVKKAYEDNGGKALPISLDLETIGLDPYREPSEEHPGARIVSVSVTYAKGQADVYYVPESGINGKVQGQLKTLCQSPKVKMVGANLKFDMQWIRVHWGFWITNHKFDTTLVGSMINENISNSLNIHAKLYTTLGGYDDPFNAEFDKSRMDLVPQEALLDYAGGDTDACLRTYDVLRGMLLQDAGMANLYTKLLQPASSVFAKLEHRGVQVDVEAYKKVKIKVAAAEKELHAAALTLLPRKLRIKYRDNLKLTRPVILREFLFTDRGLGLDPTTLTAKGKLPSTAMGHLEEVLYENPNEELQQFVDVMKEWGSAKKTLSTYCTGFMKHIRSDGKFHPSYMLFHGAYGLKDADSGTVTGRLACKDPAWQTLPKHTMWAKLLRTVYTPPPGMAILKLDYSQGELRVTACVANEPVMIKTYLDGIDLHLKTGAMVNGYELEEALEMKAAAEFDDVIREQVKKIRQGGKAGNFGLIYGMGAEGFMNYAKNTYGVHWDILKCEQVIKQFFATYEGLHPWHDKYRGMAGLHGLVRSPLGRIRHLPLVNSSFREVRAAAERQSINSPIQSTLSDMMLLAMVEIDKRYPDLWMAGMVHDDLMVYVPQDEVETWALRLKEVMENLPFHEFGWKPQLTFPVDAEASATNMAECEELELAA